MKAAPFDYVAAKTVAEASASLAATGASCDRRRPIAGADAQPARRTCPICWSISAGCEELKEIAATPGNIRIGALTTHAAIEDGKLPTVRRADAEGRLEDFLSSRSQSRNDWRQRSACRSRRRLARLLDGARRQRRISGLKGTRSEPIGEFVQGQYSTSLAPDEIILGFDVPRPDATLRCGSFKVVRKSGAFANSIAFAVARGRGGPVSSCSLPRLPALFAAQDRRMHQSWRRRR